MKIELAHDSIARKVYERASANDRMRLRVLNLIRVKHQLFETDHTYLNRDEVRYIRPFEQQLQLTPAERNFLLRSKILARKQEFIIGAAIILIMIGLVSFGFYYYNVSNTLHQQNERLALQDDELREANAELRVGYEKLRRKDSVNVALLDRIDNRDRVISMTTQELSDALTQLRIVNQQLEESKRDLERERDLLKRDKSDLTKQLTQQSAKVEKLDRIEQEARKTKAVLTAVEQSQKLSQRAQALLQNNETPTEAQYKEAFRLARYAWEVSPQNSQAMDVLNAIGNQKLRSNGNGGFLEGDRPRVTYSKPKIEQIIKSVERRYQYGKLSETEARRLLRRR